MGCLACEVACKQEHNLPVGQRWMRVLPDMRPVDGQWRLNYIVTECQHFGPAPCQVACPLHINTWHYVNLVAQGKFQQALETIRETTPFVGALGYVCHRPCEMNCERRNVDVPIGIGALERFLSQYEMSIHREKTNPVTRIKEQKIAIIGSGPDGLSCAYDLTKQGYGVTVFEAQSELGGKLRDDTSAAKLPRNVLDNDLHHILELGVEVKINTPLNDIGDILKQGYQAAYISIGYHDIRKTNLNVGQTDITGIFTGDDFTSLPDNVVNRMAIGKEVALAIHRYLNNITLPERRYVAVPQLAAPPKNALHGVRVINTVNIAIAQAKRCLNRGVCRQTLADGLQPACVRACAAHCISFPDLSEKTQ